MTMPNIWSYNQESTFASIKHRIYEPGYSNKEFYLPVGPFHHPHSYIMEKNTHSKLKPYSGWRLNQPTWKNMLVKLDYFPRDRGEHKKIFELPPPSITSYYTTQLGIESSGRTMACISILRYRYRTVSLWWKIPRHRNQNMKWVMSKEKR